MRSKPVRMEILGLGHVRVVPRRLLDMTRFDGAPLHTTSGLQQGEQVPQCEEMELASPPLGLTSAIGVGNEPNVTHVVQSVEDSDMVDEALDLDQRSEMAVEPRGLE